ncbi:MAG: TRAP transporter small permease subunit [Bacteroidetes bacterium]|nr:TRAP transporter small permease subunit [Bacteroidota bacterium]
MNVLKRISIVIDQLNEWIGKKVSWLTFLLVLLVCFDVVNRYLFSDTKAWVMELEWHLYALIFLFGAAYAFKYDRHVRVDLFYSNFSPRNKALVNLFGGLLFLVPWCVFVIIYAFQYANISFAIKEISPDPGGLPARYLIKYAIPLGMFFLLLQAISSILEAITVLTKKS